MRAALSAVMEFATGWTFAPSPRSSRRCGDGGLCAVEWRDGDRREYAELDCYEPFPKAGDDVRARALAWPFDEKALDYEGFFEVSTSASSALAAAGPMGAAGVGIRRLRRPVVRLRQ
jgi:hypothetical protein